MTSVATKMNGDLNNTAAERARAQIAVDPAYQGRSLAIPASQDDPVIRKSYRPFLLDEEKATNDWISQLELSTALKMAEPLTLNDGGERLKVLVLHGSMRER
jgi:arsenic resistance protein ArsH